MKKLFLIFLVLFFYIGCKPCGGEPENKQKGMSEKNKARMSENYYVDCIEGFKFVIAWAGSWDSGIAVTQINGEDGKPLTCYE